MNKAGHNNLNQERRIIIIAGSNGAGKTTFAREFLQEGSHEKNQKGYPRQRHGKSGDRIATGSETGQENRDSDEYPFGRLGEWPGGKKETQQRKGPLKNLACPRLLFTYHYSSPACLKAAFTISS